MKRVTNVLLLTLVILFCAAENAAAQFQPAGRVVFDNGKSALDIPFELNSDKIYVEVRIAGGGPYWLVLDTGSPVMILDTRVADELHVTTGEGFEAGGAGENPFILAPADSTVDASLPGLSLLGQRAFVGGIDAVVGPYEGRRIDGVLGGYNIFSEYVVDVDYSEQKIGVYVREHFDLPDDGRIVPIRIDGGHCAIEALSVLLDGDTLRGEFMLDTGLRGTLVYNTPFVNEHNLLERCGRTVYTTTGGGLGGQVKTHVGRIKTLVFGGFSMERLCVSLSQISRGALAGDDIAGIIGAGILQRFRAVFDYAGERLILSERSVDPGRLDFDKSGLFLVSDVDDRSIYRVIDVVTGSPADEAGFKVGDVLKRINGIHASRTSLEQIRRSFRRDEGTSYTIDYVRDNRAHTTTLTLRRVI